MNLSPFAQPDDSNENELLKSLMTLGSLQQLTSDVPKGERKPSSTKSSVSIKIAEPIAKAFSPQPSFPKNVEELTSNISQRSKLLGEQKSGLEGIQAQIDALKNPVESNTAQGILFGLSDLVSGGKTNFMKDYKPQSEKQRMRDLEMLGLDMQMQKSRGDLTDKELQLIESDAKDKRQEKMYNRLMQIQGMKAETAAAGAGGLLPGQKKLDTEFAEKYNDITSGDIENSLGQVALLDRAAAYLEANPSASGSGTDIAPLLGTDAVRKRIKPEAFEQQQNILKAVQSTLKSTLGAQFTAKEKQDIEGRSFDPALPAAVNAQRAREVSEIIKRKAAQLQDAGKYFRQTGGTLQGYEPQVNSSGKSRLEQLRAKRNK